MKKLLVVGIVLTMVGFGANVGAVPITFGLSGVEDPNLSARVTFGYTPGTSILNIGITNNSLLAAGPDPRLTAFAFNLPDGVLGLIPTPALPLGWVPLMNRDGIDTPGQFGFLDFAGLTGPNFKGGDPNDGIPRNSMFEFGFRVTGSELDKLNEDSFLSLGSFDPAGPPDEDEPFFIARFQRTGSDGEGSDVATPMAVPEPTTFVLLGSALFGLAFLKRRKNSKRTAS